MEVYKIKEYQSFVEDTSIALDKNRYVQIPSHIFKQLKDFIVANQHEDSNALDLMSVSEHKNIGTVLTAKNYVGMIAMKDGTVIEILPKIYSVYKDKTDDDIKQLFIKMLKTVRKINYKTIQKTNLGSTNTSIFEIFIRMFLDEVFLIVKRGLKSNYETIEENVSFYKGKTKFSQHIKMNYVHKERNYIEYDLFTTNRVENKLIKSTLLYLNKYSISSKNKNHIKMLLGYFDEVDISTNYRSDFLKCRDDRQMKDYINALKWSKIFLLGESFTSFQGSSVAYALLFPMNQLFESYVATLFKEKLDLQQYTVKTQISGKWLFDNPKCFKLIPDIVVTRKSDNMKFLFDTKWKILSNGSSNYGIQQTDMYQMYAYHKKYDAKCVTLLYPKTELINENNLIEFKDIDGVSIKVEFVDLFNVEGSILNILKLLNT